MGHFYLGHPVDHSPGSVATDADSDNEADIGDIHSPQVKLVNPPVLVLFRGQLQDL